MLAEVSKRQAAMERHLAAIRRDQAADAEYAISVRETVDALAARVERIERRLELAP
jgi:hypothetical protein